MNQPKFDSFDRSLVVKHIEQAYRVRLERVGRRAIYMRDETGKRYCLFGGYGDWHGMPQDVIDEEHGRPGSELIVAKRRPSLIEVYSGPLEPLVRRRHELATNVHGHLMINLERSGTELYVREIPELRLKRLEFIEATRTLNPDVNDLDSTSARISKQTISSESKALPQQGKALAEFRRLIARLPDSELPSVLERLQKELDARRQQPGA